MADPSRAADIERVLRFLRKRNPGTLATSRNMAAPTHLGTVLRDSRAREMKIVHVSPRGTLQVSATARGMVVPAEEAGQQSAVVAAAQKARRLIYEARRSDPRGRSS